VEIGNKGKVFWSNLEVFESFLKGIKMKNRIIEGMMR
jgi:hypothetical protein